MKYLTAIATVGLLAAPAFAYELDASIDTDGDGLYSFPELQAAYPEVTEDTFTAIDVNGDGAADMDEMAAAEASALIPASEG